MGTQRLVKDGSAATDIVDPGLELALGHGERLDRIDASLADIRAAVDAMNPARFADEFGRVSLGGQSDGPGWTPEYPPRGHDGQPYPPGHGVPPGDDHAPDGWEKPKPEIIRFLPSIFATLRAAVDAEPLQLKVNEVAPVIFSLRRNGPLANETVKAAAVGIKEFGAINIGVSSPGGAQGMTDVSSTGPGGFVVFNVIGLSEGKARLRATATSVFLNPEDSIDIVVS